MAVNRGKQFEEAVKQSFLKIDDTAVIRLQDPAMGYRGVSNICDYIVYHRPFMYLIECKSVHGNLLSFNNITRNQWEGLLKMSEIEGVVAGILCWWVDHDVTKFIPIEELQRVKTRSMKSIRYDNKDLVDVEIKGYKRRVLYSYDMKDFFEQMESFYA